MAAKYVPRWKKCINILIRYIHDKYFMGASGLPLHPKKHMIYRDVLRAAIGSLPPTQGVGGQRRCWESRTGRPLSYHPLRLDFVTRAPNEEQTWARISLATTNKSGESNLEWSWNLRMSRFQLVHFWCGFICFSCLPQLSQTPLIIPKPIQTNILPLRCCTPFFITPHPKKMVPSLAFGNTLSFLLVESEIGNWSKPPQKKTKTQNNTPGKSNKTLPTWLIMGALISCQGTFRCSKTRTLRSAANLEAKVQSVFVRCLRCFCAQGHAFFYTNREKYIYICKRF